ncbi:hypothetical protein C1T28_21205, partial [Bacillus subtilis]
PQLGHDGGQRGTHDGLVDGDHHHDEAHAEDGHQRLPEGQDLACGMLGKRGHGKMPKSLIDH